MTQLQVTLHYFCQILLIRSKSPTPAHIQRGGIRLYSLKGVLLLWTERLCSPRIHVEALVPDVVYLEISPLRKFLSLNEFLSTVQSVTITPNNEHFPRTRGRCSTIGGHLFPDTLPKVLSPQNRHLKNFFSSSKVYNDFMYFFYGPRFISQDFEIIHLPGMSYRNEHH